MRASAVVIWMFSAEGINVVAYTVFGCVAALLPVFYIWRRNRSAASSPSVKLEFFPAASPPSGPVVVVTGGSGFVGRRIIELLLAEPQQYRITVLDVLLPVAKHASVTYVRGDICNAAHVQEAFKGADAVLHVASIIPSLRTQASPIIQKVNVGGTQVVIDACKVRSSPAPRSSLTSAALRYAGSPASSTPPPPPSSSGFVVLTARCLFECEPRRSPQDFDLRGIDETTPVRDNTVIRLRFNHNA